MAGMAVIGTGICLAMVVIMVIITTIVIGITIERVVMIAAISYMPSHSVYPKVLARPQIQKECLRSPLNCKDVHSYMALYDICGTLKL